MGNRGTQVLILDGIQCTADNSLTDAIFLKGNLAIHMKIFKIYIPNNSIYWNLYSKMSRDMWKSK